MQLKWQVLVIQPVKDAPVFNGKLELTLGGTLADKPWTAVLPAGGPFTARAEPAPRASAQVAPVASGCRIDRSSSSAVPSSYQCAARSADIPALEAYWLDVPDPHTTLGAHGIGEIGITGVAVAVANAVYHATGKRVRTGSLTQLRTTVDLRTAEPGMYFLRLLQNGSEPVLRIMITR